MAETHAKEVLDRRIEELSARLEYLRNLRLALNDDSFADELASLFGQSNGVVAPAQRAASVSSDTQLGQTIAFLRRHDNAWATVASLCEGTGLSKSSMSTVLYRSGKDMLEQMDDPDGSRRKVWRIRPDRFDQH